MKNVRCGCPYTNGVEINSRNDKYTYLQDNKKIARTWPNIFKVIDKRQFELDECKALCIVSNGLKKIKLREKVTESCESTLKDALTSQGTQDTLTDQDLLISESSNMVDLGQTLISEIDEKAFVELDAWLYYGDEKESSEVPLRIEVYFNFSMDHIEVPLKVFEGFKESKKKHLTLGFSFDPNIKIKVEQTKVEMSETDNYVFGKAVLKHVRYMVELEMEQEGIMQTMSIGPIATPKVRPTYSRTQSFTTKLPKQIVNNLLTRAFSMK